MALELVLTDWQTYAVREIERRGYVYADTCSQSEWLELCKAGYCYPDGIFYRAHETYATPDFQMCEPDARGSTTQAADWQFEETQAARYEDGTLQL